MSQSNEFNDFESLEIHLNEQITNLKNEKDAVEKYENKKDGLIINKKIFEDFFGGDDINKTSISLNEYPDLKQKFNDLQKTIDIMEKDLKIKDSKRFIEKLSSNNTELEALESELNDFFKSIKNNFEKLKKIISENKDRITQILKKIAEIKYEGSDKKGFLSKIEEILNFISENFKPIDNFLNIEKAFSCWIFQDQTRNTVDDASLLVEKGEYQFIKLEKQINEINKNLEGLKKILVENCGEYGEFFIELTKILEVKNQKEFIISDIDDSEELKALLEKLSEKTIIEVIQSLSKFGLIKTKFLID